MKSRDEEIRARLLATFRVEAAEHLQVIAANLASLARGSAPVESAQVLEDTFRAVHTFKGAARSVGLGEIEALCQACESVLSRLTRGPLELGPPILDALLQAVDELGRLLAGEPDARAGAGLLSRLRKAAAGGTLTDAAASETRARRPPQARPGLLPADSIRVSTTRLDGILLQAEDLLVPKLAAQERARQAKDLVEALSLCRKALRQALSAASRVRGDGAGTAHLEALDTELRAAETRARGLLGDLVQNQRVMAGAVDGLLDSMRELRMTPATATLDLFPAMARDLAREQGKEVEWAATGAELEVDRQVLEAMKDPLIHLVRNAVDHGIEPPEARLLAGKPRPGRLAVTIAPLEGNRIEIRIEDDGSGIDLARVKAAALQRRLLTEEEARSLTEAQALDLVFSSGVSTSPIITEVSGHGLGLAIVKERVERLGGQIELESRPGAGTTVRTIVPAAIATFRGLLVGTAGRLFLLPASTVEKVIRVAPQELESVEGREAIRWNGRPLFLARLAQLLGLPEGESEREPESRKPCVVLQNGPEWAGLLLDEVFGDREVLVKEMRPPLVRVRNVAAAGLLGTGQMVLILRPSDLLRSMRSRPHVPVPAVRPESRKPLAVLVVDDSITTRTMEKNILEAQGYRVRVAVDGVEAWTLLRSEEFDLVVSDVDMPRMDGFDLTARIRSDKKLADLPVILVTALESREDRERGIEVGANAYVVKSTFDQSNLLEILRRLV